MPVKYTDQEIAALIVERKPLPHDYRTRIQLREKQGHKERELDVRGENGNEFRLILRQSSFNPLDFSIILAVLPPDTNQPFRLKRYNGKSHEHTNHIEGNTFYDFHIHIATERYQEIGIREDAYAEPTENFADFHSAIRCMINECAFALPKNDQLSLFEEMRHGNKSD